jgi:hypothetical protein
MARGKGKLDILNIARLLAAASSLKASIHPQHEGGWAASVLKYPEHHLKAGEGD